MDSVDAEDVRDLVRVCDNGRRAERQDEPRELVDEQLDRLEMHVRVDEPGDDPASGGVEGLLAVVVAEPCDHAVGDRDVDLEPLPREHGEHTPAADDEIGGHVAAGDGEAALQRFHAAHLSAAPALVQAGAEVPYSRGSGPA